MPVESTLATSVRETLAPIFERRRGCISVVYLFGSSVCGDVGPTSDIDLAVLFKGGDAGSRFDLKLQLYADCSRILQRNDIDIVVMNDTRNLFLLESIVNNGVVIFEDDVELRQEYEVKVIHDFIDFRDQRLKVMGV